MDHTTSITSNATSGIRLQSRITQLHKYRDMVDPKVATAPMGINLDADKCVGCGLCVMQCPCQVLSLVRRAEPSSHNVAPCTHACPAGIDVSAYMQLLAQGGSLRQAWAVITQTNPFPAITGRICPHPCEAACNRQGLDEAVNINCVERAVGDFGIENNLAFDRPDIVRTESVAVVGSGPSGMSCAYQLAKMGYRVTVLEAGGRPGGMLADSIPGFRLPERVVDREMARIIDFGVTMSLHTTVGKDVSLQQLKAEFDAVYLAIGAHGSPALGIEGETATNVLSGLSFLEQAKAGQAPPLDSQVIVVGGGNTGIDAARTARRLGAKVTMLYRRTSAEMPADAAEVDAAQEEGVDIRYLSAPLRVESSAADTLLTCQKMMLGELDASGRARPIPVPGSEFTLRGTVIAAVGQELCAVGFEQLELSSKWIRADRFGRTGDDKVFAGGDAVSGPGLVVEAIGAGAQAARAIDAFLRKTPLDLPDRTVISFATVPLDKLRHLNPPGCPARRESPRLAADLRLATPQAEESLAFSPNDASTESKRCFGCGHYQASYGTMPNTTHFGLSCVACHNCDAICPHGAIEMNGFYRVDEGRWTTPHDVPVVVQDGLPNPLRLPRPTPFAEIASKITEVERVIYTRRSTRVFNPEPLPRELIERVLEAGRFAPSAGNCEGVKYVVITDRAVMDDLDRSTRAYIAPFTKMYANKKPANQWLKRLLCLLYPHGGDPRPMAGAAAVLDPHFGDGPMNVFFDAPCAIMVVPHALHISDPEFDAGLICQNMVLAAHSLGLGSCYVGFPTSALKADKKTRRKFQGTLGLEWPFDRPSMIVLIGYPKAPTDNAVPRLFPPVQWVQAAPPGP